MMAVSRWCQLTVAAGYLTGVLGWGVFRVTATLIGAPF
jgi:hypothetical protein